MTPRPAQLLELKVADLLKLSNENIREVPDDAALKELAASIREHGILEPLLVFQEANGEHSVVAGHRRLQAARLAKLLVVPCVRVLEGHAGKSLNETRELQLIENLQRQDLSPLEEAKAFRGILDSDAGITQGELAKRIGKSQPYVANRLRLLTLPEDGLKLLESGKISPSVAERVLELPAAADRERKSVVRSIERDLKGNAGSRVTEASVEYTVREAKERFSRRQSFEQLKAKAKYPDCPKKGCGKPATALEDWYSSPPTKLRCSDRHCWSAATGKLDQDRFDRGDQAGQFRSERPTAPPKPTLPEISPVVQVDATVDQIARRLLDDAGKFQDVHVQWAGGELFRLELTVSLPEIRKAKVPGFSSRQESAGKTGLEFQGAESWNQQNDAGRRAAAVARAQLEAWTKTVGAKPGRKAGKKEGA